MSSDHKTLEASIAVRLHGARASKSSMILAPSSGNMDLGTGEKHRSHQEHPDGCQYNRTPHLWRCLNSVGSVDWESRGCPVACLPHLGMVPISSVVRMLLRPLLCLKGSVAPYHPPQPELTNKQRNLTVSVNRVDFNKDNLIPVSRSGEISVFQSTMPSAPFPQGIPVQ